jgi:hypothetical protein
VRSLNQSDRLRVRDEVDLVPPLREFQTEFSGDYTAPAICGIARNPDLQGHGDSMVIVTPRFTI